MSLKAKAFKGAFWSTLEVFGNQIISFVISLVLARLLLPEEFGLIAMLTVFMALAGVLVESGLTQSLIRTPDPTDEDYSTVFFFNLGASLIMYGMLWFTAPLIASFYEQPVLSSLLRILSTTIIIGAFSAVQRARLTKQMDFKTQLLVSTPSLVINGVVGIVMAYMGYGVWSLVWSRIAGATASAAQLWYWAKWKPLWAFSKVKFHQHFGFGVKLMISSISDTFFEGLYTIIIGKFYPAAQVGFYNKADGLQKLPVNLISGVVSRITYPLFSEIQSDDKRLKDVYQRIMQLVIFLIAPTLVFMAVLAEPIIRFLFTEKWLPAAPYFQVLCTAGILYPIHAYNLQILNVKGRSDLFLRLEIIRKIVLLIVIVVSFQFGIYGLLFGKVLFSIIVFGINTHYSGKFIQYGPWQQAKDLLPTLILAGVCGFLVVGFDSVDFVQELHDFIRILLGVGIGFLTFVGLAQLFKLSAFSEIVILFRREVLKTKK